MTIAAANMANAIREITVEQGHDPRGATLAPFGGAGPLFGTLLAHELEIRRIVVPPYAGNFSAWGLLGADLTQSAARTRIMKLGDTTIAEANEIVGELFAGLAERAAGRNGDGATGRWRLDMRYVGQEHTITIPLRSENGLVVASLDEIRDAFTREYAQDVRSRDGRGGRDRLAAGHDCERRCRDAPPSTSRRHRTTCAEESTGRRILFRAS